MSQTENAPTDPTVPDGVEDDVISDPGKDDDTGSDWSDEGGATEQGPATDAPAR